MKQQNVHAKAINGLSSQPVCDVHEPTYLLIIVGHIALLLPTFTLSLRERFKSLGEVCEGSQALSALRSGGGRATRNGWRHHLKYADN